jgi:hypothetical protein
LSRIWGKGRKVIIVVLFWLPLFLVNIQCVLCNSLKMFDWICPYEIYQVLAANVCLIRMVFCGNLVLQIQNHKYSCSCHSPKGHNADLDRMRHYGMQNTEGKCIIWNLFMSFIFWCTEIEQSTPVKPGIQKQRK